MRVLCTTVRVLWLLFDLKRYVASLFSVFSKSNFGRGRYPGRSATDVAGKTATDLAFCLRATPLLNRTSSPPLHALLPPPAGPPRGSAGARGAHTLVRGAVHATPALCALQFCALNSWDGGLLLHVAKQNRLLSFRAIWISSVFCSHDSYPSPPPPPTFPTPPPQTF